MAKNHRLLDFPLGHEFLIDDETFVVVEGLCEDCDLIESNHCIYLECEGSHRKDKEQVCFIRKKVDKEKS